MRKHLPVLILVILILGGSFYVGRKDFTKPVPPTPKPVTQHHTTPKPVTFNKTAHSTTDPNSLWVVVNKAHALNPRDFVPSDLVVPNVPLRFPGDQTMELRADTAAALEKMVAAAKSDGIDLMLASGYRSYNYQVSLYNSYVNQHGQTEADTFSARPGHSEHQTGLALDIEPVSKNCEVDQCFGGTPEGQWVAAHAAEYGFIIRYTVDNQSITGYEAEPWHLRYVGVSLAQELAKEHVSTLEQFFDVSGSTTYVD